MMKYPEIDPVAFHIGSWPVHWYGIMYLLGFLLSWLALASRIRSATPPRNFTLEQLSDILFYGALGVILGGRIGYMVFYNSHELMQYPWHIVYVWQGGMSFHGGAIGVIVALWLYSRKLGKSLLDMTDFVVPAVPIGLAAGRIGNFINGELWGRVTDVPWAMVFPMGGDQPRHPSQLYEFLLEGVVMFVVLWCYSRQLRPRGAVSGLFLVLYGLFRILIEFFREPDWQVGYLAFGWLTEGQLLSVPMVIFGLGLMIWAYRRRLPCNNT